MELTNEFTVDARPDRAWDVLTDVETIAPCLPGAQLQEVEGEEYRGTVKVKVGPITAQYRGAASFVEQDEAARRIVLRAEGRETRGQGNATATVTAELAEEGEARTRVRVHTDLALTGKVAQFGRGVLADVSARLMDQFAENLSATVLAGAGSEAPPVEPAPTDAPTDAPTVEPAPEPPRLRLVEAPEAAPVDLLQTAGAPVARRLLPAVGVVVAVAAVVVCVLRRRRR